MRGSNAWFSCRFLGLSLLAVVFAGCGRQQAELKSERDPGERPILKVLSIYSRFQRENNRSPANTEELKGWLKRQDKTVREQLGADDVEKVFISPRDNQPFQINPPNPRVMGGQGRVVIYEKVGVDGKRQTASSMATVAEMDEETLRRYVPNLGKP